MLCVLIVVCDLVKDVIVFISCFDDLFELLCVLWELFSYVWLKMCFDVGSYCLCKVLIQFDIVLLFVFGDVLDNINILEEFVQMQCQLEL